MRIVLSVTKANPELFEALESVPPRLRAERLRILATIGLMASKGVGLTIDGKQANRKSDKPIADEIDSEAGKNASQAIKTAKKLTGL
jgi:hypothetical protein